MSPTYSHRARLRLYPDKRQHPISGHPNPISGGIKTIGWHPISGLDAGHADREVVELIYFPTGGGKTEAYLGVIATVLLLRRLRGIERPDGGDGVAVILRYTLRLLTLDQLSRAATLICALELLRRELPELLGKTRFAIGLWVGKSATANTLKAVAEQLNQFKNRRDATAASPLLPQVQVPPAAAGSGASRVI